MRVSVGDVHLFFEVFGQEWEVTGREMKCRPVLVGLHGGPGVDGTGLRHNLAPLTNVAQVIVPDQRGHGRSDLGTPESWNLATWADDLSGFSDALGLERPFVLGISFGGFVAQQYASTHGDEIAGLILISTAPRFPDTAEVIERVRVLGGDEAAEVMRRDIENPTDETAAEVRRLCGPLYTRRDVAIPVVSNLERHYIRTPRVIAEWWPEAQRTMDLRAKLHQVRCPTLVLIGEHDPLNPPSLGREIVEAIPNGLGRLEVIPDSAHSVFSDNPEHVRRCIEEFIAAYRL
jgi:proline-specific peptidase